MTDDAIDFVFSLILDTELYLCAFVLLTYFTTKKINKIIQSNFYQNDALLNRLSKHFYIVDVKAYFSPLKYMFKSALYHTYYFSSLLFLIYLFRLYTSYKRWIKFYFFSLLNISTDPSIHSGDDNSDAYHHGNSSGFDVTYLVAFILGVIISFIYYKYLCRLFKGKHKYVTVHKSSLQHYCFELAKVNFREYVKVKPKKGSKFRFDLDTNIKPHSTFINESAATKGSGTKTGTSGNGRGAGSSVPSVVAPKPKRNILFRMFNIVYVKNHVLYDENVLYEDHLKNKWQANQKNKEGFLLMLIKLVEKLVKAIINLINAENNETGKAPPAQRQSSETTPQEQTQGKTNPTNMTQIRGSALKSSDQQYNDINLCELDLNPYDVFVCNSHYQFKSILEVLMLHIPIYFLFKNKLYVKTCFTVAMYVFNYLLWNFITFLAMIKPSLFVYYYVLNEHINHILTESINDQEKNIILHFFYGFFFASLIYLKYHFNMEFKLIKVEHMNHFHRLINRCIAEANKLKSRGIIRNFEAMKIFPLCIDYKNKGILIDRGLLRTAAELQLVLRQRRLKSAKICFQNVKKIAKHCDEDTAMEMFKRLKFVLVNELPHRVAVNLSLMISDEMYDKIKRNAIDSSSSEQSKKHPPDCLCETLKKTAIHDFIKAAMGIDKSNAEMGAADLGQANEDTSDNKGNEKK
ncbi:hypothetical protein PCYB_144770 [Plasmodium cynomolgi strain B]|uniref:Uncharacterized protein n=1 Tax=Plasmodium cynomolgi (strain B) TaxID=1120755 RepID=K6UYT2_PLACD|nr:hypothetical protein PCYB_144770 [Plasmodium cynomolgi strain B]GAB69049.1 hypothetical protein PCYB_144770 [Plasmodium cynomolgi strain B]